MTAAKSPGTMFGIAQRCPAGRLPKNDSRKKSSGTMFDIAQRWPEGRSPKE